MNHKNVGLSRYQRIGIYCGLAAVLGIAGAFAAAELVQADESDISPQQIATQKELVEVVDEQIEQAEDQQTSERAVGFELLGELPLGAQYAAEEELTELQEQRSALRTMSVDETPESLGVIYEEGYFTSLMALDWQCAWISEAVYRAEQGEQEGVEEALKTLWSFEDNELAESFPDYARKLKDLAEPLRSGNVDYTKRYLAANCMPEALVY